MQILFEWAEEVGTGCEGTVCAMQEPCTPGRGGSSRAVKMGYDVGANRNMIWGMGGRETSRISYGTTVGCVPAIPP